MSLNIEQFLPGVQQNGGISTALPVTIAGNLTVTGTTNIAAVALTDLTTTGNTTLGNAASDTTAINGATTITSTSASALTVGRQGATSPVLKINAATASVASGIEITGAASGSGVAIAAIGGTNEALTIDAKGTGTVTIAGTSTGAVTITPATTITGLATLTAGLTSPAAATLKSATAVPATAGAVAAGAPIICNSNGMTIEWTTDAPTHVRPKGSLCLNINGSSSSTRLYVNSDGSTAWVAITTAT